MKEEVIRKLSEILKKAQYLHGTLRNITDSTMISDRIEELVDSLNDIIQSGKLPLTMIPCVKSWNEASSGNKFAYKADVLGALSEIIGSIESLPELRINQTEQSSEILKILNLAKNSLRKAIRQIPSSEEQIKDYFENLLIGAGIIYSRETDSIEYSSKTYTPDFTFPPIDLALEFKFCGNKEREKQIIVEINDDILAYQTKYKNLIFIVYDLGFIRDIDRFVSSFEAENIFVEVVKH